MRLRTAVTGRPDPVGICWSVRPDNFCSSVLLPTRARPLTPILMVSREKRPASKCSCLIASVTRVCNAVASKDWSDERISSDVRG